MSARIDQPTRPGWRFWLFWMLATIVGAAAGLVLSLPLNSILVAVLGRGGSGPWTATETALILAFKGAEGGVTGMGIGLGQWWVFRRHLTQTGGWVLATGLACVVQNVLMWNPASDIFTWQLGGSMMLSAGVFLGLFQWFVLRGHVPYAGWWIPTSIAGWVIALLLVVASSLAQLGIERFPGIVFFGVVLLVPFAVTGVVMVWLLRQTAPARQPIAS